MVRTLLSVLSSCLLLLFLLFLLSLLLLVWLYLIFPRSRIKERRVMTSIFLFCAINTMYFSGLPSKAKPRGLEVIYYHDSRSLIRSLLLYDVHNTKYIRISEHVQHTKSTCFCIWKTNIKIYGNSIHTESERKREREKKPTRNKITNQNIVWCAAIMCVRAFVYLCRNGQKKPLLWLLVIS